jgi:N-acetylneuraminic acid mutarotase
MNTARFDATATLLPNGKVLIAGGVTGPGPAFTTVLASVELYDSGTNSFAPAASLPSMNQARMDAAATLLGNGKVLIAGGETVEGGFQIPLNSVELYDPATNSFAPLDSTPTMNLGRSDALAALLLNSKVLVVGSQSRSVELYDPMTNSFASAASTPMMGDTHVQGTATLLSTGEVLLAGGSAGGPIVLASTDLYDPTTNSFATSTPSMNVARSLAAATLLPNDKVLIAGGVGIGDKFFNPTLNSVELYDPAANSFAPFGSLPGMNTARVSATATPLNNGKVLVAGGEFQRWQRPRQCGTLRPGSQQFRFSRFASGYEHRALGSHRHAAQQR